MKQSDTDLKEMVNSCLAGDRDARIRFQDLFGDFIYNYPTKAFHLSSDNAADFYIYVFENDRVFKRLKGFEGRNNAQFKTYLGYYVLRDLFFEWQRGQKVPDTISLESAVTEGGASIERTTFNDLLSDHDDNKERSMDSHEGVRAFKDVFANLDPEKRLVLKLLHLPDFDLDPDEIRLLCKKSGRSYKEIINIVEEVRNGLRRKDEQFESIQNQLDSIFGWILLYQKELVKIGEALQSASEGSTKHNDLDRQKEELERKLQWRYRQRKEVLEKAGTLRITTPYKDIARFLNVPLGTVCSLVSRIRGEVSEALGGSEVSRRAAVS